MLWCSAAHKLSEVENGTFSQAGSAMALVVHVRGVRREDGGLTLMQLPEGTGSGVLIEVLSVHGLTATVHNGRCATGCLQVAGRARFTQSVRTDLHCRQASSVSQQCSVVLPPVSRLSFLITAW